MDIIISALVSFSFLSLATLGIVLIFKTSTTTNFAQGMLGVLGAYTTSYIIDPVGINRYTGLPSVIIEGPAQLILPIIGGIITSLVFGYLIDVVIFRRAKYTNAATKQIITMGLVIIITGLIPIVFGETTSRASFQFTTKTINFLGVPTPVHGIVTFILATVVITLIFIFLKFTKWGLGVRSVASNEKVAGLMGVNTNRINATSWGIAGGLGALSAITYTAAINVLAISIMVPIQINAFYSSILGGFQTFFGPLVGAFLFTLGQSIIPRILSTWNLAQWGNTILYMLIMFVVLIKPNGLFGKKVVKKV